LVDHHGHSLLAMIGLATEDPDRLCVVDEHVEDRREGFHPSDWNESGSQTRAGWAGQIGSEWFAGFCE